MFTQIDDNIHTQACHIYAKLQLCVRQLTEGQWKRFDLETQDAISLAVEL